MVAERLRQSPVLSRAAVVLITAYKLTVEEEKEVIKQAQADKLLYKPLPKFADLKQMLETAIKDRQAKAALPEEK